MKAFTYRGTALLLPSLSLNMASVGKGVFSAFLPLTEGNRSNPLPGAPGYFPFPSSEHLHTETVKSQSEDGGRARRGGRNAVLFSLCVLVCVCVLKPLGPKLRSIYMKVQDTFFPPSKLVCCKVIKPWSGSRVSQRSFIDIWYQRQWADLCTVLPQQLLITLRL